MDVFVGEFLKAAPYQYEYNVVWLIGLNDQVTLEELLNLLQQTKDEQAECLDFVRNCTICCEPYDDKERHRVGLRNSLKISL